MYSYEQLRHVHLELTTRCNARCPMCARNACGEPAPGLVSSDLSIEDMKSLLPPSLVTRLEAVDFCGAYGDPILAPDVLAIVRYVREVAADCRLTLYTNGGVRTTDWWAELAQVLGDRGRVVFAIDGVTAATSSIHRRGVDFDKAMANAEAFIAEGGDARWEYLVFRHNEAELAEALDMSRRMGFREFSFKKTDRFLQPSYEYVPEVRSAAEQGRFPIHDLDRKVVGYLEPPADAALVNRTMLQFDELLARHGSLDALFGRTPIRCRVLETSSVFVSARAQAFPCCWVYVQATRPQLLGFPPGADLQVWELVQSHGGLDALDARRHGLEKVVQSPLFEAVERSWGCGSVSEGRLKVCARACGTEFPAYFDQFGETKLVPRSLRVV